MSKHKTATVPGSPQFASGPVKIIVIKLGWVLIGRVEALGDHLRVSNAHVIRVWGTDHGLGQIAFDGPTAKTILDPVGIATVSNHSVLFLIDANEKNWPNV